MVNRINNAICLFIAAAVFAAEYEVPTRTLYVIAPPMPASTTAAAIAPFKLSDQNGREVSDADLSGRPAAVFFGYTYCPDVCPTTLASLSDAVSLRGPHVW